ncbi:lactoylglutathione lyase [Mesorhizobium sp. Root157]|uniref:VOC family protein n=1 Tax=Mesorhizobium sp. Root157 TaxID=1736477 RepID=UPI0007001AD6|nr:VOC family protein [Mesorhizobium sp. Root157]KQZ82027.1 lactoylglutathione lyase [Mesorhizobium sp. Root157]
MTHPLDHLVLPTADLAVARARLLALGFMVSPRGVHPFGTENCCVYFADGSFMEPLAVGDARAADMAIAAGNVFVARDRKYRERLGDEGFSAVVFGTSNADADHRRYCEAGFSAGARLDFSRPFVDAAGKSDTASFRLAFASGKAASDAFQFSCERVDAPRVDRAALQTHDNSAAAIVEVVAIGSNPSAQLRLLGIAADASPAPLAETSELILPNAKLSVVTPQDYARRFGLPAADPTDLRFAAVVFSVASLRNLRTVLAQRGIGYDIGDEQIIVAPAPGQGAAFIFKEQA